MRIFFVHNCKLNLVGAIFLGVCIFSSIRAEAKQSPSDKYIEISSKQVFQPHYGVNFFDFWGIKTAYLTSTGHSGPTIMMRPSAIIYVENGETNSAAGDLYFVLSGDKKPAVAVSLSDQNTDILLEKPAIGQAYASAIRFFNGVWEGYCQTFLVLAEKNTNEETNKVSTSIKLYVFDPGSFNDDDDSQDDDPYEDSVIQGPVFRLLKEYISLNKNPDPQIVLAQEFLFPLPISYSRNESDVSSLSKALGLPIENQQNVYDDGNNMNCSAKKRGQ